jgi:DNA-binding NarL/FixJ family response regulator
VIRVAVVDDQVLVRTGLRVLLQREPDLDLVGEAADGGAALSLIRRTRPDVVLLDIRMPGPDGLDVLRAVAADPKLAGTRTVMMTTFERDEYVFAALRAGASGFVLKDSEPADLVRAVRAAAAGEALLSPSVARRVTDTFTMPASPVEPAFTFERPAFERLTAREREVVAWATTGGSNEEIAATLFLSPATVRTHIGRAMLKVGARDRTQLVVFALHAGLQPR